MKNINNLTNLIKFEEFFKINPNLNQLNNGLFSVFLLSDNSNLVKIIHIGDLNDYSFYLPIEINQLAEFIIFNKNVKPYKNNINYFHIENILIYNSMLLFTNQKSNLIKNTNKYMSNKEKTLFCSSLFELGSINFNQIQNQY